MPIYEYSCTECGHEVELIQKLNARAPRCEKCSGKLKKLVSRASFQLKGGGWYADGYGDSSGGSSSSSSSSSKSSSGSKKKKSSSSKAKKAASA